MQTMCISFLISILLSGQCYCQLISGRVEGNHQPLSMVNISLLKEPDSAVLRTAITDDNGQYQLTNIPAGNYILIASKVGYKRQYVSPVAISATHTHTTLPTINMEPAHAQLTAVTVTGKRPFIEQKTDRTIVNVANSIIGSGSTALEVLEKAPGITIDQQNDQIIFRGKEGVIVQIDGKQTYLSAADAVSLLRSMPAGNIDRIELISNPSARYDAAGNAGIIDIRLKKNNHIGTNGVLTAGAGSGRYGRQRTNLQINHRAAKINLFANYGAGREGNYRNFDISRSMPDSMQTNYIQQHSFIRFRNSSHNAKAGIDYFISKKTTAGIVWTGIWDVSRETSPATTVFRRQPDADAYISTLTDKSLSTIQSNHLFNINLAHLFNGNAQLSTDIDMGRFNRQFSNFLTTRTLLPADSGNNFSNLLSYMPTAITILTFKTDYNQPIGKNWKMETGIKISRVRSDNNLQLSTGTNGHLLMDTALSNHFLYAEDVYAGYMSISGKLGTKTDVLLGLRAEYTHSGGHSITFNNEVTKKYLNAFPSFFLTRSLHRNHTLHFSYSYRIDRPNYQSLNPARSYLDPYAYSSGNPYLTPQYTHSLEIKYGYKNKLFTSLGATYTTDLVFFVVQPTDGKTTQRMPENIGTAQGYYLTANFPVTICKGWTMQTSLTGTYNQFQYRYKSIPLRSEQISGRINNSHAVIFGKGWTGELSGRINTPSTNAITHSPWLGSMDAGIQKAFLRNWKAKLIVQDIWHTNYFKGKINVPAFTTSVWITADSRIALLTITFSFGNQQLKGSRQRKTAAEEELQRTN